MDLLVLPSKNESFGLVLIEAMALNVPVVATNTVGARSIIQNNRYGYIVENNIDGLINGIGSFVLNQKYFKEKSRDALKYIQNYSSDIFAKNLISYLEDIS